VKIHLDLLDLLDLLDCRTELAEKERIGSGATWQQGQFIGENTDE
jgi:hypothetical protein